MSGFDFFLLIPLVYFAYKGAVNGIVKEVFNIVGLVAGVYITFAYINAFSALISPFFEEGAPYVPFLSGIILFAGTLGIVAGAAHLLKKSLEAAHLSIFNRVLGVGFGILKASIILSAILLLLSGFSLPENQTKGSSLLYSYILPVGPSAYNLVASGIPGAITFKDNLKESLEGYNISPDSIFK